jgi:CDP-2,3-bis-(O-geranylgeranyl)-sn-glycerol synthase
MVNALWIAAPVIVGGLLHIAAMRMGVCTPLARVPLDGGATVRGRRVFGDNKTLRGAVLMVLFTVLATIAAYGLAERTAWAAALTPQELMAAGPIVWGGLLGAGYVLGELPNSFVKRQLSVPPGEAARGWLGPVFWIVDQIDSLAGAMIALSVVWVPPLETLAALLVVTLVVHPLVAWTMVAVGLKTRIG